nr:uncharacterized protein LOC118970134 [Manis javanica]
MGTETPHSHGGNVAAGVLSQGALSALLAWLPMQIPPSGGPQRTTTSRRQGSKPAAVWREDGVQEREVNARKTVHLPGAILHSQEQSSTSAPLKDSIPEKPVSSIPLTGDSQTDSDILAFIKARQSILQKKLAWEFSTCRRAQNHESRRNPSPSGAQVSSKRPAVHCGRKDGVQMKKPRNGCDRPGWTSEPRMRQWNAGHLESWS